MAPGRPTYHHGDLRQALLDGGWDLAREQGERGFSLRAVARAAKVDPAAVYRHFADKDDLLRALVIRGFGELAEAMQTGRDAAHTPDERFLAIGEAYLRYALAEPEVFALLFSRPWLVVAGNHDACADEIAGPTPSAMLLSAIEELASSLPPEGRDRLARLVWTAVHGLANLIPAGFVEDVEQAISEVLRAQLEIVRRTDIDLA